MMAINCDPSSLANAARCFFCWPDSTLREVRTYLLCQIATVGLKKGSPVGAITNFQFAPSAPGTTVQGAWDPPPASATGTELWTSTDNITFTLASTTPSPGAGATVPAPAVGSFKWGKARWVSASAQGAFSSVIEVSGRACDWAARVITNGGAATTLGTRNAINTLDLAIVAAGLDSKLVTFLPMPPDSIAAAITPLYKVKGSDPYMNNGPFVAGDLSVNGLAGNGTTKWLAVGVVPNVDLTLNSNCWFMYESVAQSNAGELFGVNSGGVDALLPNDSNNGALTNYYSQGKLVSTAPILTGFYLGSRVNNTDQRLYFANSANAWAQVGATQAGAGGALTAIGMALFAVNTGAAANFSNGTLSAFGIASGLTSAQGQSLFNAIDAFRIALGGGRV